MGKDANDTEAPSAVVTAASDTEAVKDETVYVMTAADGSTQKILVSDWIKNALPAEAQKAIESLNDAQQVKDDCWDRHHPEGAAGEHEHPLYLGRQDRHPQRAGGQERQGDHPLRV